MEIPIAEQPIRTCEIVKRRTLKDGTVREYKYKQTYTTKSDIVMCGKRELIKKITNCKDKGKIKKIKDLCEELEL